MFLAATRRRNPALIETAAALHAEGRVPAGSYVVDIDTVAGNARLVADAARARGLVCWQMTKQFGRNPLVAAATDPPKAIFAMNRWTLIGIHV